MIKLHDGTSVRVQAMRMSCIYGGMLEGLPTKEQNDGIIEEAKTSFYKLWGQRPCHVVDPPRREPKIMGHETLPDRYKELYPDPERLPDCMFQVWLDSWTTYDENDDGTQVVLVFFASREQAESVSMADLIKEASKSFAWKDVAKGFGF